MKLLQLNCGSGQRKFSSPPFTNIDINPAWTPELVADVSALPYADNSCSLIVSHHQLEHVELTKSDDMLREWYRLLAPGGSLLVFVPNIRALAGAWLSHRISDYTFFVNLYGAYMGNDADIHRWGYDHESLHKKLCAVAPWREVKRFDGRKVPGADLAQDWWILNLEAVK